jgi:hypothetical protein
MSDQVEAVGAGAAMLLGSQLAEVRYFGLPVGFTDRPWWERDRAHSVDYGLDLVTSEGTYAVTWVPESIGGYGLDLAKGSLLERRSNEVQVAHVEDSEPWVSQIGSEICTANLHVFPFTFGERTGDRVVALSIQFSTGFGVCLVCGSWDGDDSPIFVTGDDIVVIWKNETVSVVIPGLAESQVLPPGQ